ncbi:hypothetical protein M011DRAFT_460099 [Sporormia fimetaria CBS 119925]|uniref:Uncharacterized protein n=1 Tax=Sporormia fimetaria CBS 119925 TaxID=1340428 RepID=A0A6A6V6L0_9PLEO|nr:hypothetical protein M011DRAFT_460099 [Sporormia fimetaria CBS 119925]
MASEGWERIYVDAEGNKFKRILIKDQQGNWHQAPDGTYNIHKLDGTGSYYSSVMGSQSVGQTSPNNGSSTGSFAGTVYSGFTVPQTRPTGPQSWPPTAGPSDLKMQYTMGQPRHNVFNDPVTPMSEPATNYHAGAMDPSGPGPSRHSKFAVDYHNYKDLDLTAMEVLIKQYEEASAKHRAYFSNANIAKAMRSRGELKSASGVPEGTYAMHQELYNIAVAVVNKATEAYQARDQFSSAFIATDSKKGHTGHETRTQILAKNKDKFASKRDGHLTVMNLFRSAAASASGTR